ncbi:hypothetical protein ACO22_00868 [Paracoccidioides brasiliensis]|uniref:Uncharacterized protein n=1 Tax=Paracoccidioides brasiliensis TaxID=121759 RepID=A0A1D2JN42_PARBR|nr:hypothetical protein ACO22_00868 [Paracoccidioides brasiliensis]ODH52182.1 hypothetical protein GX48_01739 [Paracoccidioides brasiliensis]
MGDGGDAAENMTDERRNSDANKAGFTYHRQSVSLELPASYSQWTKHEPCDNSTPPEQSLFYGGVGNLKNIRKTSWSSFA